MSKKEISTDVHAELRNELAASYPSEPSVLKITLPRIEMYSQDKFEGKGKAAKLIKEAGMFVMSKPSEEVNKETGKKVWGKEEIGNSFEGVILYQRKQLRHYDEATESYTSSPVYDNDDEVLPLFCDKKEVARNTPEELKKGYEYVDKEGKTKNKLEDNRILYVLNSSDKEIYQLNLRGSSMWAFKAYARNVVPNTVVTSFSSEAKEKGSINWNQMTFRIVRELDNDEIVDMLDKVRKIKNTIAVEKQQFSVVKSQADAELDALADAASKLE